MSYSTGNLGAFRVSVDENLGTSVCHHDQELDISKNCFSVISQIITCYADKVQMTREPELSDQAQQKSLGE